MGENKNACLEQLDVKFNESSGCKVELDEHVYLCVVWVNIEQ